MGRRLLVVDDDRDFAESLEDFLVDSEYEVECAFGGEEAIHRFAQKEFDLALVDIQMPGRNGIDCLEAFRALKPGARVVLMTGYAQAAAVDRAAASGASAILDKPLDIAHLTRVIDDAMASRMVVLVDDDGDFTASMEELLRTAGYAVRAFTSSNEAIEYARGNRFGILLLDLRMPSDTGVSVYEKMCEIQPNVRPIVVTAYAEEEREQLESLSNMAVESVLHKPFAAVQLLRALEPVEGGGPAPGA